jgi:hypothetical protein
LRGLAPLTQSGLVVSLTCAGSQSEMKWSWSLTGEQGLETAPLAEEGMQPDRSICALRRSQL